MIGSSASKNCALSDILFNDSTFDLDLSAIDYAQSLKDVLAL